MDLEQAKQGYARWQELDEQESELCPLFATAYMDNAVPELIERVEELEATVAGLRDRVDALVDDRREAIELLCIMHRDGGHHVAEVGFAQACRDAIEVRHALVAKVVELEERAIRGDFQVPGNTDLAFGIPEETP